MFDDLYDLNTISGALSYSKHRGFFEEDEEYQPYRPYNRNDYDKYEEKDDDLDFYNLFHSYINTTVPKSENVYPKNYLEESYSEFTSLMPYIKPSNEIYNNCNEKSPVNVKLSINDNKYDLTFSNIKKRDIYGPEMFNKEMEKDLFDELEYHYRQRYFIKNNSKDIVESACPLNNKINEGDILKIHSKILKVIKYNSSKLRHELKELNTGKFYEFNLSKVSFDILITNKTKNLIKSFDKNTLNKATINHSETEHNTLAKSDLSVSTIHTEIETDTIELIDNYFKSYENNLSESVFNIVKKNSPKYVIHQVDDEINNFSPKPLINNFFNPENLETIEENNKDETLVDENDIDKTETSSNKNGYGCVVM